MWTNGSKDAWLRGPYRIENGLPVFVILTREPGEEIRSIHDLMSLIMPGNIVNEWIKPSVNPEELPDAAMTETLIAKRMMVIIGNPIIAAILAGIMLLFFRY